MATTTNNNTAARSSFELLPDYNSFWFEWTTPLIGCASYGVVIFLLHSAMRLRKKGFELKWFNIVHNAFLCVLSFVMAAGTLYDVAVNSMQTGFFNTYCDPNQQVVNTRLFFWSYIFYISKYYEFLDTVILVLRKKPLLFLHVYHHLVTAACCYLLLEGRVSMSWQLTFLNSLVHTFMYYYYTAALLGYRIWWKKYLTTFQIVQFLTLMASASVQIYWRYFAAERIECSGDMTAFFIGLSFVLSLTFLFAQFYRRTYSTPSTAAKKQQ
eukprot:GEZU01032389.1.p1 GENE.GEZU01032389.1~~GEZU01032389.1.p1  ORF type:complete len:268 (+),score=104.67 GEZU01032389.1:177-980(+)